MVDKSNFSEDILDFILLLNKNNVRYVIVGGEAVIYYGYARLTGDVDFYYDITKDNIEKLYSALQIFWSNDIPGIKSSSELSVSGNIFQFGVPPNRIDLINTIDGVNFSEVWENRLTEKLSIGSETYDLYIIGIDDLIKNKRATGRHKDLEDLEYLTEAHKNGMI